jgi:RNA polymerase sigma-70 factor (ECF subfamily)
MKDDLRDLGDAELVLRAQDGSAAAFEILYDRHAAGVARALASFAGPDHDLLDDLVQDVFMRVVRGLASYAPSHPFAHWLYTVALNVGRNHARRVSKVVPVNPSDLEEIAGAGAPPREGSSAAVDLTRLVSMLPVAMREVVSLRAGADMDYGEIAEILGIPEGTARSRMHNAVRILRDRMGVRDQRRSNHRDGS